MNRRDLLRAGAALPALPVIPFRRPTPVQVMPTTTWYASHHTYSAISRSWPPGTTYEHCRRCPASMCSLCEGHCLVTARGFVGEADAEDFRLPGSPAGPRPGMS